MTLAAGACAYHVIQIRPAGYVHAEALSELAQATFHGLRRLGCTVYRDDPDLPQAQAIVFGAHLLDAAAAGTLPSDAIIYNTEQILPGSPWLTGHYMQLLRRHRVWDYSDENARRLADYAVNEVRYVPVGYVPELSRIGPAAEDIDILFYGSVNPRRKAILDELSRRGLQVVTLFGSYGEERDRLIARAKVVLIVHFYPTKIFEVVRAAYLFTNFKAVVAECGADTCIEPGLREAIHAVPYDGLVAACVDMARDDAARRELAARGHAVFRARAAVDILAAALGMAGERTTPAQRPPAAAAPPRLLHLGSGKDFRPEFFNVDINPAWGPDAVVNIAAGDIVGTVVETARFGTVRLQAEYFDVVVANDVLERIADLTTAMTNCLKLLRPGGRLQVSVPYELSLGAWQDPTHIRALNENSWLYYTEWHWYLGWVDMRFDTTSLDFTPSPFGAELIKAGKTTAEVLRTPRAIDTMRVVLRKRYLQPSEILAAQERQPGPRAAAVK